MRLSDGEREGILRAVRATCDAVGVTWKRVLLFGSRAHIDRRGGDIDLLVELDPATAADPYRLKQKLLLALEDELGEQKMDVLIENENADEPFLALAKHEGKALWIND